MILRMNGELCGLRLYIVTYDGVWELILAQVFSRKLEALFMYVYVPFIYLSCSLLHYFVVAYI